LNNDDDDENDVADFLDVGDSPLEDDLVMLHLDEILNGYVTNDDGTVYLQYGYYDSTAYYGQSTAIRLWLRSDKGGQPLETFDHSYGWALPEGVTTVWAEGTQIGVDTIYVVWLPSDVDGTESGSAGNSHRHLGNVIVEVSPPTPGKLTISESYWGTPEKRFRTADDNILWRHNTHQVSFEVPAGFDLKQITSFKVYTISDEDIADTNVIFPTATQQVLNQIYNSVVTAGAVLAGATHHISGVKGVRHRFG